MNNCWFGYNNVNINNANVIVSNNALFSISENQIAPGLFEITGKLMWNDTTMDGIDKLGLKLFICHLLLEISVTTILF